MSYYNKGPNFARNAIHKGSIDIGCTQEWINANQLYNYVLSHETVYGLTMVRMEPIYIEEMCLISFIWNDHIPLYSQMQWNNQTDENYG